MPIIIGQNDHNNPYIESTTVLSDKKKKKNSYFFYYRILHMRNTCRVSSYAVEGRLIKVQ